MIRSSEGQIDAPIYPNCAMPMRLSRVIPNITKDLDARASRRKVCDTEEIACWFKSGDEHVRRVPRIGYLAPDIIEAIIEGRQPRSMTVKRLLQRVPCDWADQRAAFDFARS